MLKHLFSDCFLNFSAESKAFPVVALAHDDLPRMRLRFYLLWFSLLVKDFPDRINVLRQFCFFFWCHLFVLIITPNFSVSSFVLTKVTCSQLDCHDNGLGTASFRINEEMFNLHNASAQACAVMKSFFFKLNNKESDVNIEHIDRLLRPDKYSELLKDMDVTIENSGLASVCKIIENTVTEERFVSRIDCEDKSSIKYSFLFTDHRLIVLSLHTVQFVNIDSLVVSKDDSPITVPSAGTSKMIDNIYYKPANNLSPIQNQDINNEIVKLGLKIFYKSGILGWSLYRGSLYGESFYGKAIVSGFRKKDLYQVLDVADKVGFITYPNSLEREKKKSFFSFLR